MKIESDRLFSPMATDEKAKKNLAILNYIKGSGPVSLRELLDFTEMNSASLFSYLENYAGKALIAGAGTPAIGDENKKSVELNNKNNRVIGLDVGDSVIRAVITDLNLNVSGKGTRDARGMMKEAAASEAVRLLSGVIREAGMSNTDVKAVGIGVPNNNSEALQELISKELGLASFAGTDAACAAFGEKAMNKDEKAENMLFIYSGAGCGIVVKDDIYFGAAGNAGGIRVADDKSDSRYLRPWGREMGMAEMARKEASKGIGTKLVELAGWNIDDITDDTVVAAAQAKDDVALDIVGYAARNLGVRIAYLVNLFNPEVVFIGGGIEKAGELILQPIRETVVKLAFAGSAGMVRILPSALGIDAVTLGAASLAVRELFIRA